MKRILSLIVALAMMVSAVAVYAADDAAAEIAEPAYTYDEKAYADAQMLMQSLLGSDVFGTDPVAEVTRAQFVAGTAEIFNIPPMSGGTIYSDVPADNAYAGYIAAANAAGWIADAENFNPDRTVTLAEAVKILLTAAQYNAMADAKGGFPGGYLTVANSIDLLDSVDTVNAEKVTVADASILFYNLMLAPVFEVVSYGDEMEYERGGKNYLEMLYDAYPVEGIVTATNFSSLLYGAVLDVNSDVIAIDGIEYKCSGVDIEYLGKKVTAYVDDSSKASGTKKVLCLIEDYNDQLEIIAKDYIDTDSNQLVYDEDGRERKAKLDGAYKVIYNGRRVSGGITSEMLSDEYATIRLLNADGNSSYEVIFVDAYTYLKVANVDYISGYVSFVDRDDRFIDLNGDVDVLCTVYNTEGQEVELFEITNNIIVGVKSSLDKLVHEIVMCPEEPVSGEVVMYDAENNTITLDEVTYEMSKDFVKKNITDTELIKVGDVISAYVGLNGELVYLNDTESEYIYGLLTNAKKTEGVNGKLMLEIFTNDGYKTFDVAKKLGVDSFGKFTDMKEAVAAMPDTSVKAEKNEAGDDVLIVTTSVIKYSTNADGEVTHIDFADDKSTGYDPAVQRPAYDSLTKVQSQKSGNYRPGVSGLVGTVILSNATMIVDLGDTKDKEDRYFYTSSGSMENNYSYTMDLYDVDEHGYAGFAFVTSGPTDSSRSTSLKTYIIEKCSVGITDDYKGYNLTCYGNGSYGTYFLPEESLEEGSYKVTVAENKTETVTGKRIPKPGDLIRFTIESGNIIDEYYVDFYCETALTNNGAEMEMYEKIIGNGSEGQYTNNNKMTIAEGDPYSDIFFANGGYTNTMMRDLTGASAAGYVTGYVYNSEKSMVLCNGTDGEYEFANFRPYLVPNTVVLFDTQARKVTVTPYMPSAIKTYKANPGSEDFVVLRNNAGKPEIAFVYR